MIILGIETSCDETAVSLVAASGTLEHPSIEILGNVTLSQSKIHARHGGVFPMLAKREHSKNLLPILEEVLRESNFLKSQEKIPLKKELVLKMQKSLEREADLAQDLLKILPTLKKPNIDTIAVTYGPGLEPALWVGINFAKALGIAWDIPVIPINHMEGHIASVLISGELRIANKELRVVKFPTLALLISGGHTELVLAEAWGKYKILGSTRDDAVGEVFDKVGRMLGLPYPAGPEIGRLAKTGRALNKKSIQFKLPRPMINSRNLDFSFSGLKTAVLYNLKKIGKLDDSIRREIAREFEDAVTETLVAKTKKAVEEYLPASVILAGGVSANTEIRESIQKLCEQMNVDLFVPPPILSTDNALMIAAAGFVQTLLSTTRSQNDFKAAGNLKLA